ncbi:MAG: hypothetical protein IPO27_00435 [Bacteroidetes bacterium]|nr:hypothetical protein [Bacteroidota bacterium]
MENGRIKLKSRISNTERELQNRALRFSCSDAMELGCFDYDTNTHRNSRLSKIYVKAPLGIRQIVNTAIVLCYAIICLG